MDDDAPQLEEEGGGSPAWMATFADLMSLLMCFFVLLLAFSEMDVLKFKQLAGSMREAFGVQREIKAMEMPKGTSIIAQEFSPGRPSPSPIIELRQQTTDEAKANLDFGDLVPRANKEEQPKKIEDIKKALKDQIRKMLSKQLEKLKELLGEDIAAGTIQLESEEEEIVIRIREKGSFPSAKAQLQRNFYPILSKIGSVLKEVDGSIIVSGHTDNLPIFTSRFPSNWVLSAARAASVVHHLTTYSKVGGDRIEIRAYADSRPVDTNKTRAGRAKNRRVEISVRFGSFESISAEDLQNTLAAEQAGLEKDSIPSLPDSASSKAALETVEHLKTPEINVPDTPSLNEKLENLDALNSVGNTSAEKMVNQLETDNTEEIDESRYALPEDVSKTPDMDESDELQEEPEAIEEFSQ